MYCIISCYFALIFVLYWGSIKYDVSVTIMKSYCYVIIRHAKTVRPIIIISLFVHKTGTLREKMVKKTPPVQNESVHQSIRVTAIQMFGIFSIQ